MEMGLKKEKRVDQITDERLDKYLGITGKAIEMVKSHPKDEKMHKQAHDLLDMAERYFSDAIHFRSQSNYVLAFAAVSYAHAWLDAGARLGMFKVKDSQLFAAD